MSWNRPAYRLVLLISLLVVAACPSPGVPTDVVPDFGGAWDGSWVVTVCRESDDFIGRCAQLDILVGTVAPVGAMFVQAGRSVSAMLTFGGLTATTGRLVTVEGELHLDPVALVPAGPPPSIRLQAWRSQAVVSGAMTGSFQHVRTGQGSDGSVVIEGQLEDVRRTVS
jgi:hypothetical protein